MIKLRNFTNADISLLKKCKYEDETNREIQEKIKLWNSKNVDGKYYEMFAIVDNDMPVGMISLYQHTQSVISCGPEIFEEYRGKGYGTQAVGMAIDVAKKKGYKIVVAQIRKDNEKSIMLHQRLGFELDHEYINKRGNEVGFYIKYIGE
ncbi:MAG: GNAT family N-acetyltransferase [Lachnospiraceae bacterium]|nr:GNAT family N-acetyltransferase [Lachnospiraceae bacterium]